MAGRVIHGTVSTPHVDRHGERVDAGAWDLREYRKNPVVLFNHGSGAGVPVGKTVAIDRHGDLLRIAFTLADTPRAREVEQLVRDGVLRGLSPGFTVRDSRRDKDGTLRVAKAELLEVSLVPIPANPRALLDLDSMDEKALVATIEDMVATAKRERVEAMIQAALAAYRG